MEKTRYITWIGTSLDDLRVFPDTVKKRIGFDLMAIQHGQAPVDSKPMPGIGQGVREIRVRAGNQYRVIYIASYDESIYVLHSFVKKTRATAQRDINLARKRLQEVHELRRKHA